MKHMFSLAALILLAACASPRETCLTNATRDLNVVQSLIADMEATIARGYAIRTEERLIAYTDFCFGAGGDVGFSFCRRLDPVTTRKPVAVNLDEERAKLRSLKRKEVDLRRASLTAVAQCDAQYPAT